RSDEKKEARLKPYEVEDSMRVDQGGEPIKPFAGDAVKDRQDEKNSQRNGRGDPVSQKPRDGIEGNAGPGAVLLHLKEPFSDPFLQQVGMAAQVAEKDQPAGAKEGADQRIKGDRRPLV